MAKKSRVWDGTAWQELASAQTDLTAYSTTAQMNTAITAGVGLVPILTQTIGTAVSSVVVSNAFSATYDAYKIFIIGGAHSGSGEDFYLKLGASTTGYYGVRWGYRTSAATGNFVDANNGARFHCGTVTPNYISMNCELLNPFLTKYTLLQGGYVYSDLYGSIAGEHRVATSYTDFTLTPNSGTITGGTIYVYGFKK